MRVASSPVAYLCPEEGHGDMVANNIWLICQENKYTEPLEMIISVPDDPPLCWKVLGNTKDENGT